MISTPMDNLPKVLSVSFLSDNNLSTTMVLLKENATPRYIEVIWSQPNHRAIRNHRTDVTSTCTNPARNELLPRSLMILGLSSIPTMKSRKLMPIFENEWKASLPCRRPGKKMLISVPAMIYPIIIGCFNIFMMPIATSTIPRITLSEIKICSDMR